MPSAILLQMQHFHTEVIDSQSLTYTGKRIGPLLQKALQWNLNLYLATLILRTERMPDFSQLYSKLIQQNSHCFVMCYKKTCLLFMAGVWQVSIIFIVLFWFLLFIIKLYIIKLMWSMGTGDINILNMYEPLHSMTATKKGHTRL